MFTDGIYVPPERIAPLAQVIFAMVHNTALAREQADAIDAGDLDPVMLTEIAAVLRNAGRLLDGLVMESRVPLTEWVLARNVHPGQRPGFRPDN